MLECLTPRLSLRRGLRFSAWQLAPIKDLDTRACANTRRAGQATNVTMEYGPGRARNTGGQ
jgi:hypothetical protein